MFFLTPRRVKQGRTFAKDARKLLAYKRDLWSTATVAEFERGIGRLEEACATRDQRAIADAAGELDKQCVAVVPVQKHPGVRENTEVFLVAIVIALAVRTFFLQPFTIPTGSMQPTLNGILGTVTQEAPPNLLVRLVHTAVFGRTYVNTLAEADEKVLSISEQSRYWVSTYTQVRTDKNSYWIHAPRVTLHDAFAVRPGRTYRRGEPIARGYINTGDHVFVDKFTYHFRPPRRGEVFVFNTLKIPTGDNMNNPDGPSQFYIKRLAGLPGDELRIAPPELFVNGQPAKEPVFRRVIEMKEPGYRGYSNGPPIGRFPFLGYSDQALTLPPKHYFAMGDNSFHSSDSRDWGTVPQRNIIGRGVFVYWPFTSHWGRIH